MVKNILRQPKIYTPPKEQEPFVLPKIFKILILVVIVFLALVYILLFSPLFKIKYIEIVGEAPEAVKAYLEEYKNQNIFLINIDPIRDHLASENNQFLSVQVLRGIPNTLRVKFVERSPKLIWQSGKKQYLVDSEGTAFKEISMGQSDLPIVIDNKELSIQVPVQVATKNFVDFIRDLNSQFIGEQDMKIVNFEVNETTFQVDLKTSKSIKLIFDTTRPLTDQLDAFGTVYKDHKEEIKEYVDLRVEGIVYYK